MQHCHVKPTTVLLILTLLFCHANMMASSAKLSGTVQEGLSGTAQEALSGTAQEGLSGTAQEGLSGMTPETLSSIASKAASSGKLFRKCRFPLNPYYEADMDRPFKNTRIKRYRMAVLAPSSTTSEYNNRASTTLIDKKTNKAYLFYLHADNTLSLIPTERHITKVNTVRPRCTIKLSIYDSDPQYIEKIEQSGKNSKIRQARPLRLRPSHFKSLYNQKRTTALLDIDAKKYYFIIVNKEDELQLLEVTRDGNIVNKDDLIIPDTNTINKNKKSIKTRALMR